jgi:hypothetical protein
MKIFLFIEREKQMNTYKVIIDKNTSEYITASRVIKADNCIVFTDSEDFNNFNIVATFTIANIIGFKQVNNDSDCECKGDTYDTAYCA